MTDRQYGLCNLCGNSCCPNEKKLTGLWKSEVPHGLINAKVVGGYESYHLFDMSQYTFSFCESCLRQLFIQCKVKPKVHNMNFPMVLDKDSGLVEGDEESWEEDQIAYEYRVWRDEGKHHEAYLNKLCNRRKDCPNKAVYTVMLSENFTEDCVCEEHKGLWGNTINAELVPFITNVFKPFL